MGAIVAHEVKKAFGKTEILHGVSLSINYGEIVGLVGPSGSGKTTLIDLLVGATIPGEGRALLNGEQAPFKEARRQLGFMPQDTALYEDITAYDNLSFFGSLYGSNKQELKEAAAWALELAQLEFDKKKLVQDYSGGMKRRLSLAVALINRPYLSHLPVSRISPCLLSESAKP